MRWGGREVEREWWEYRFAWLPVKTDHGITVWLEFYKAFFRRSIEPLGGRWVTACCGRLPND